MLCEELIKFKSVVLNLWLFRMNEFHNFDTKTKIISLHWISKIKTYIFDVKFIKIGPVVQRLAEMEKEIQQNSALSAYVV